MTNENPKPSDGKALPPLILGQCSYTAGEVLSDAERRLWQEFHSGYGDMIACDRKDLTAAFPSMIPEGLSARVKDVPVSRDDLWKALTGTWRSKKSWNN